MNRDRLDILILFQPLNLSENWLLETCRTNMSNVQQGNVNADTGDA